LIAPVSAVAETGEELRAMWARTLGIVVALLAITALLTPVRACAATPYEAQLGGLIHSLLNAFIIGEFGGRTVANPHFNPRPICKPEDYDDLREAAKDNATLIAFHQRCRLIESTMDGTHVHAVAYLPPGHCEAIKNAFETMLAKQVHAVPYVPGSPHDLTIEFKEIRLSSNREFIRRAELTVTCQPDSSIRVSAPQKQYRSDKTPHPISMMMAYSIVRANALKLTTIGFAALIALFVARLKWVLAAAAIFAVAEYCVLYAIVTMIFGSGAPGSTPFSNPSIYALDFGSTLAAYLCWASVFFLFKWLVKRQMKPAPGLK
jgi:hypothetical protein